ncbi:TPA: hypothetical protein I8273_004586 [Aeromonas hydrophila]|nr:hypothetical protein [Aeromonas hydrophila]
MLRVATGGGRSMLLAQLPTGSMFWVVTSRVDLVHGARQYRGPRAAAGLGAQGGHR